MPPVEILLGLKNNRERPAFLPTWNRFWIVAFPCGQPAHKLIDEQEVAASKVDIHVDGVLAETATYGGSRPDVANDWPHAPAAIGYNFWFDASSYSNGPQAIEVRAISCVF
jgi:hypothetical protein